MVPPIAGWFIMDDLGVAPISSQASLKPLALPPIPSPQRGRPERPSSSESLKTRLAKRAASDPRRNVAKQRGFHGVQSGWQITMGSWDKSWGYSGIDWDIVPVFFWGYHGIGDK